MYFIAYAMCILWFSIFANYYPITNLIFVMSSLPTSIIALCANFAPKALLDWGIRPNWNIMFVQPSMDRTNATTSNLCHCTYSSLIYNILLV